LNVFHCDCCRHLVFFENTRCVQCGHVLAYLPDVAQMASIEPDGDGLFLSPRGQSPVTGYRLCRNYTEHNVCNWAIRTDDSNPFCLSCRLTGLIPDQAVPGHHEAWYCLEVAKRRLLYTLQKLQLPMATRAEDPAQGLAFEFLAVTADAGPQPALTGHRDGIITINIAEADNVERERRRIALHEPYRTLLGHFRHEIGHYYWSRLIQDSERLEAFRQLFGDERLDYAQALRNHYETGAPPDWQDRFVSSYATAHPWEDWAETWAHYLHVSDTLETAAACGISIRPLHPDEPAVTRIPATAGSPSAPFDELMESWFPLTYVLNNLNRGLGLPDGYPFVLSTPALDKMRFVHDTIVAAATADTPPLAPIRQGSALNAGT
jgi:hypothetical protein